MNTPLQQAAQELIDRWDSPMWRYQQATTDVIAELRKALTAEIAQSAEPAAWAMCRADGLVLDVICPDEHESYESYEGFYTTPLYLHPPQPQATYSDSTPLLHVGNSSFEDWFQERDRAGKSDKQLAREAYAAGMGDPLVTYAAAQGEKP